VNWCCPVKPQLNDIFLKVFSNVQYKYFLGNPGSKVAWKCRGLEPQHPIRVYFWPAVNKRPCTFWPDPIRFFLTQRAKIWKMFDFKGKFFKPKPKKPDLTQPEQQKFDPAWPWSKCFDPDPSPILFLMLNTSLMTSFFKVFSNAHSSNGFCLKDDPGIELRSIFSILVGKTFNDVIFCSHDKSNDLPNRKKLIKIWANTCLLQLEILQVRPPDSPSQPSSLHLFWQSLCEFWILHSKSHHLNGRSQPQTLTIHLQGFGHRKWKFPKKKVLQTCSYSDLLEWKKNVFNGHFFSATFLCYSY